MGTPIIILLSIVQIVFLPPHPAFLFVDKEEQPYCFLNDEDFTANTLSSIENELLFNPSETLLRESNITEDGVNTSRAPRLSMNLSLGNPATRQSLGEGRYAFETNNSYQFNVGVEYFFPRQQKDVFRQHSLSLEVQTANRIITEGTSNSIFYLTIPLMSYTNFPNLYFENLGHLFSMKLGLGYHINIPVFADHGIDENELNFFTHGLSGNWGINLNLMGNSSFGVSYYSSFDYFSHRGKSLPEWYDPPRFVTTGFRFTLSTPIKYY